MFDLVKKQSFFKVIWVCTHLYKRMQTNLFTSMLSALFRANSSGTETGWVKSWLRLFEEDWVFCFKPSLQVSDLCSLGLSKGSKLLLVCQQRYLENRLQIWHFKYQLICKFWIQAFWCLLSVVSFHVCLGAAPQAFIGKKTGLHWNEEKKKKISLVKCYVK